MANFITRVELHNATAADYNKLHQEMLNRKFGVSITSSDGKNFKLPTATYISFSQNTEAATVREWAREAAEITGRNFWILTANYNDAAWYLHEEL